MAKEITPPADFTSHNRYLAPQGGEVRTDRADAINPAPNPKDLLDSIIRGTIHNMSPYYLYSVREVAAILSKAEDTIRKEAKSASIGIQKEGRYWFNSANVEELKTSFDNKRKDYLHRQTREVFSLSYALFQRITAIEKMMKEFIADRERFSVVFYEWFTRMNAFKESVEERLKEGRHRG